MFFVCLFIYSWFVCGYLHIAYFSLIKLYWCFDLFESPKALYKFPNIIIIQKISYTAQNEGHGP